MLLIKVLFITFLTTWVTCTISGLNYMDPFNFKPLKTPIPGEDPCNPLYWYPRNIPEHCYYKIPPKPQPYPVSLPIPVPLPQQPYPFPMPMPPMPPQYPMPPLPMPMFPPPMPLPFGVPLSPTNPMLPVAGIPGIPNPYNFQRYGPRAGLVPGLPGLVTHDGAINILPFSDAYADILEKHKQKMIRKKLQRVLDDYEDYPRRRKYRRHGRG